MRDARYEIRDTNLLVWLPSPMGDAVLCTPALRAIRQHFKSSQIAFFAKPVVREVLSPSSFNDIWLEQQDNNPFRIAKKLGARKFTHAILFKNSFASGLAVFLARIPSRIGYAREGRSLFLTDKLYPLKLPDGKFKPLSMIDYYLAISSALGADAADRKLELFIDPQEEQRLRAKLPELFNCDGPIVAIVPGGAFGPSKCWLSERFAQTADWLTTNYNATVVVSVSSAPAEKQIANEICHSSKHKLVNLAERPISLGELKSFFSIADLVISNDTGPRHIAIALRRKVISLFGPNDPAWTDTSYENEIQLIGDVPCAPCRRPVCKESEHLCMQAITAESVCKAAQQLLEKGQ
jgi:heptosyltransferase-2